MTSLKKQLVGATLAVAVITIGAATQVVAFGGDGQGRGGMMDEGRGGRHGGRGAGFGFVTEEMRDEWHAEFESMSDEERDAHRQARQAMRDEQQAKFEEFSGISHDEMRAAHRNGKSVGDLLQENGVTQESAETFLTEQTNEKVEMISERHDLTDEETANLFGRVAEYVQNKLSRWFN